MTKSFREWIAEGEELYNDSMKDYQLLETQIAELESKLTEKKDEVNKIAQMIGKPPVEGPKRVSAQLVEQPPTPASAIGSVTRALTGRGVVARMQT